MTKVIIILIQVLIFVAYLVYTYKKHGMSESISASAKHTKILFTGMCIGISFPLLLISSSIWFSSAVASLIFTGIAWEYWSDKGVEWFHVIGSYSAIILSLIGLGMVYGYWLPAVFMGVGYLVMKIAKPPHTTWWAEVFAFGLVTVTLLFHYIILLF